MKKTAFFALLLALLLLAGCGGGAASQSAASDAAEAAVIDSGAEETPAREYTVAGEGRITGEAAGSLTPGQQALILDFMHRYYQSVGTLEPYDCADLFSSSAQAEQHAAVWQAVTSIRKQAQIDLSLADYDFTLDCTEVETAGSSVSVSMTENSVLHFAGTPGVDSEVLSLYHGFTLTGSEAAGWRISRHLPWDSAYYPFLFGGRGWSGSGMESATPRSVSSRLEDLLYTNFMNIEARQSRRQAVTADLPLNPQYGYDRQAAVDYARQWASQRNDRWPSYDRNGGNCMNYVSQALLAGGIPMDGYGAAWYWYGDSNRTPSWSGVNYFVTYAENNSGYGMVCDPDANYYTGEPGDVIVMGTTGYRHVVMISDVITDDAGETVDYLICSNTGNYRDFPAGAYFYTNQRLIKIYGWNG